MEPHRDPVLQPTVEEHKWKKYLGSIFVGFIITVLLVSGVASGYVNVMGIWGPKFDALKVMTLICYGITALVGTFTVAKVLRTKSPEIQIQGINIPNPFFSRYFVKLDKAGNVKLVERNEELTASLQENKEQIENLKSMLIEATGIMDEKDVLLEESKTFANIFVRYSKNASRLVRSLHKLLGEKSENWKKEFMNNVLNECVTTLFSDKANKSSSLFLVNDSGELEIFAYNRIDTQSAREKKFKPGEGFAGLVWQTGETMKLDDVYIDGGWSEKEEHLDHYLSIIGTPVRVKDKIVGVLCIQSEELYGFEQDDEVMTRFYADICGLAEYCDMILKNREGEIQYDRQSSNGKIE